MVGSVLTEHRMAPTHNAIATCSESAYAQVPSNVFKLLTIIIKKAEHADVKSRAGYVTTWSAGTHTSFVFAISERYCRI